MSIPNTGYYDPVVEADQESKESISVNQSIPEAITLSVDQTIKDKTEMERRLSRVHFYFY